MPDIAITWDQQNGRGIWQMSGADLQSGSDLQSGILMSLFTDQVAPPDYQPPAPAGSADRRGWWADTYNSFQIGSLLWTLARAVKTTATLKLIEKYASDALAWMIAAGAVASFDVAARWVNRTGVALQIVAHKPTGQPQVFQFGWAWGQIASVSSAANPILAA
jgi:phage gp46-like protein